MDKKKLLDIFLDLLNSADPITQGEVEETLRDAGYDPEQVGREMKEVAQRAFDSAQTKDGK